MKTCYKCRTEQPRSCFSLDKSRADGLQPRCKSCYAEYKKSRQKPPRVPVTEEHKQAKARLWREKNKEILQHQARDWAKRNPEKMRAATARFVAANPELLKVRRIAYKIASVETDRAYRIANRHRSIAHVMARNARKLQATPAWANNELIFAFYENARALMNATGDKWHVDHIVPLRSDRVCGLHCESNLQLLPACDNMSKGNRWWPDMPD